MKKLLLIIPLLLFSACEEQLKWSMDETVTPRLVVEGILTNNSKLNYVKLGLPVKDPNSEPQALSGANVTILSSTDVYPLEEIPDQPGYYISTTEIIGVLGEAYRLHIAFSGYVFLSDIVRMYPVSPIKEFRFYEAALLPGNYVINPADETEPSFTKYEVKYHEEEAPGDTLISTFYTYTLRSIDVNQFFKPKAEWLIFPENAMIIRTKYSIAPAHERFIRGLLSETEWSGGWFDVMPGNLQTNMSQGAVGYFGACSVLRDTVYFK